SPQNRSNSNFCHNSTTSQHAPHWRGRHSSNSDNRTRTIDASAITASKQSAGNNESVLGCSRPSSNTSIDLRPASSCDELIPPRYNTWLCPTRPPAPRLFSTMLVAVLFTILLAG